VREKQIDFERDWPDSERRERRLVVNEYWFALRIPVKSREGLASETSPLLPSLNPLFIALTGA
jgi:hypothetical protein